MMDCRKTFLATVRNEEGHPRRDRDRTPETEARDAEDGRCLGFQTSSDEEIVRT
jgi:hypothetical protein